MGSEAEFWGSIKSTLGGWKALVLVAVFSVAGTALAGEMWRAPQVAQDAMDRARLNDARITEIERSINRLERTVRIYLCSREDLGRSTRFRLNCREFE